MYDSRKVSVTSYKHLMSLEGLDPSDYNGSIPWTFCLLLKRKVKVFVND